MEDVLELYAEPHDPARPVVCFDEASNRFVYQYNASFGKTEASAFGLSQQFQVQLGAR